MSQNLFALKESENSDTVGNRCPRCVVASFMFMIDVPDPPNPFLSFHKGTRSKGCESVAEDDVGNLNSGREMD